MAITPYHKPVSGNPVDTYAPINWDFINQSLQQKDVAVDSAIAKGQETQGILAGLKSIDIVNANAPLQARLGYNQKLREISAAGSAELQQAHDEFSRTGDINKMNRAVQEIRNKYSGGNVEQYVKIGKDVEEIGQIISSKSANLNNQANKLPQYIYARQVAEGVVPHNSKFIIGELNFERTDKVLSDIYTHIKGYNTDESKKTTWTDNNAANLKSVYGIDDPNLTWYRTRTTTKNDDITDQRIMNGVTNKLAENKEGIFNNYFYDRLQQATNMGIEIPIEDIDDFQQQVINDFNRPLAFVKDDNGNEVIDRDNSGYFAKLAYDTTDEAVNAYKKTSIDYSTGQAKNSVPIGKGGTGTKTTGGGNINISNTIPTKEKDQNDVAKGIVRLAFLPIPLNTTTAQQNKVSNQNKYGGMVIVDYWNGSATLTGGRNNTAGTYVISESLNDSFSGRYGGLGDSQAKVDFDASIKQFTNQEKQIFNTLFVDEFIVDKKDIYSMNDAEIKRYLEQNLSLEISEKNLNIDTLTNKINNTISSIKNSFDVHGDNYKPVWSKFLTSLETNTNEVIDIIGNENRITNLEVEVPTKINGNNVIVKVSSDGSTAIEAYTTNSKNERIPGEVIPVTTESGLTDSEYQNLKRVRQETMTEINKNVNIINSDDSLTGYMAIFDPELISTIGGLEALARRGKFVKDKMNLSFNTDVYGAPISVTSKVDKIGLESVKGEKYQFGTGGLSHNIQLNILGQNYTIENATTHELILATFAVLTETNDNIKKAILSRLADKIKINE